MTKYLLALSWVGIVSACSSSNEGELAGGDSGPEGSITDARIVDGVVMVGDDGGVIAVDLRDPVVPIKVIDPLVVAAELLEEPPVLPGDALIWKKNDFSDQYCLELAGPPQAGTQVMATACEDELSQRWLGTAEALMPAADDSLCVDTNIYASEPPTLTRCSERRTDLTLQNHFLIVTQDGGARRTFAPFENDGTVELIAWNMLPEHANWFWSKEFGANAQARIDQLEARLTDVPPSYPHPSVQAASYEGALAQHELGQVLPPYPGVQVDPSALAGELAGDAPLHSVRVFFDRSHSDPTNARAYWSTPPDWQSTGVYAPPGASIAVVLPGDVDPGLEAIINVHTDELLVDSPNLVAEAEFRRPPRVSNRYALKPGVNLIRSAFGGSLVLSSSRPSEQTVPIDIHGGVEQARFVRDVTSTSEWQRRRALSAPWVLIEGQYSVVVVPREQVQALESPNAVAARYDRVVELERELAGFDDSSPEHRVPSGKFWFVTDRQISAGYGHSGNPVMVLFEWNLAREDDFGDGWGVWHELGHNHQQFQHWSARFGVEVTCNAFSLYVQQTLGGGHPLDTHATKMATALAQGTVQFDALTDVFEQLVFLAQPAWAFPEQGFLIYQGVNRATRELDDETAASIAQSEPLQVDHLYVQLSTAVGHDLLSHFQRWGFSPSKAAIDQIATQDLPEPSAPVWSFVAPGTTH